MDTEGNQYHGTVHNINHRGLGVDIIQENGLSRSTVMPLETINIDSIDVVRNKK